MISGWTDQRSISTFCPRVSLAPSTRALTTSDAASLAGYNNADVMSVCNARRLVVLKRQTCSKMTGVRSDKWWCD